LSEWFSFRISRRIFHITLACLLAEELQTAQHYRQLEQQQFKAVESARDAAEEATKSCRIELEKLRGEVFSLREQVKSISKERDVALDYIQDQEQRLVEAKAAAKAKEVAEIAALRAKESETLARERMERAESVQRSTEGVLASEKGRATDATSKLVEASSRAETLDSECKRLSRDV